jgi:endoribonuclease Dicer
MDAILEADLSKKFFTVAKTGAKLTYGSSLTILAHYASTLVRIYIAPNLN